METTMADPASGVQSAADKVAKTLEQEWEVFASNPWSFGAAVVLVGIVIWFFLRYIHRAERDALKEQVDAARERRQLAEDKLRAMVPSRSQLVQQVEEISAASDLAVIGDVEAIEDVKSKSAAASATMADLDVQFEEVLNELIDADLEEDPQMDDPPSNILPMGRKCRK